MVLLLVVVMSVCVTVLGVKWQAKQRHITPLLTGRMMHAWLWLAELVCSGPAAVSSTVLSPYCLLTYCHQHTLLTTPTGVYNTYCVVEGLPAFTLPKTALDITAFAVSLLLVFRCGLSSKWLVIAACHCTCLGRG